MKKTMAIVILALGLTACNNERTAINTVQSMKTPDLVQFDSALKSLMLPENRPTPEDKLKYGTDLNDKSLDILYKSSVTLLTDGGERVSAATTRAEKQAIVSILLQCGLLI